MSEHAVAQTQKANTPQETTKSAITLQRRPSNLSESTILQERLFDTVSSTFTEPRFGYDFSRVPAHSDVVQQMLPLLRTRTMVQRFPKSGTAGSAPCATCPEAASAQIPVSAEPAAETAESFPMVAPSAAHAEPMTEPVSPETETTPAPAEPTTEPAAPGETTASGLIVEDSATELAPGQMRKSEFIAQLRAEVTRAAEAAMAGTGRTTADCPYLDYWFDYYSAQDVQHGERALRRYAPEASSATSAREYIPIIAGRVRRSVETWVRTGEVTGVPEGLPGMGLLGSIGSLVSGIGSIFFKARNGGAKRPNNPRAIQAQLGKGQPLDSGVRSRMESAFGMDFSHVRTHTDPTAAGLSNDLNARAFTVGEHVAFGSGEYKPGTLIGDALIAHEMAHVVQQSGASDSVAAMQTGDTDYSMLENDADKSAIGAVASLWKGTRNALSDITPNVIPRLRSGLRLQRCKDSGRSRRHPRPSPTDFQIRGKINAPSDTDNIYFDRNVSSLGSDLVELAKIPRIITNYGATARLTLNGFRSEDEPTSLASSRVDAVYTELGTARTTAPAHPAHTGTKVKVPQPSLSVGHMDYRNWRKVEVLTTPTGLSSAPTRMPPPCPAGPIPCPPIPNAFTRARTEALRLVNNAITPLTPAALSAATPTPDVARAKTSLRDLFGGTNPSPAARQATGLTNAPAIRTNLTNLRAHITAMPSQHECRPRCYGGCGDRPAYNTGTGIGAPPAGALMTLCPEFFDSSRTLSENANDLIHEGSHGTAGLATTDVAYATTRRFPFLSDTDALRNADSYVVLVRLIDAAGSASIGPGPSSRDIVTGMNATEERAALEAIAYLEQWLLNADFDTEILYSTVHRSLPPASSWATRLGDVFNRDTMARIAPLFGLTHPGTRAPFTQPNSRDRERIASIHERFLQMRRVVYGRRLTITKISSGSESWATGSGTPGSGAGLTVSLSAATLALSPALRVRRVLALLVAAIPDISPAIQPKYVEAADRIRQHRGTGP